MDGLTNGKRISILILANKLRKYYLVEKQKKNTTPSRF